MRAVLTDIHVDSLIFVVKFAGQVYHSEVELLADKYRSAISLFSRDCGVYRRDREIIDEARVTIEEDETFQDTESAAFGLANHVGYISDGTVERQWFLESQDRDRKV